MFLPYEIRYNNNMYAFTYPNYVNCTYSKILLPFLL